MQICGFSEICFYPSHHLVGEFKSGVLVFYPTFLGTTQRCWLSAAKPPCFLEKASVISFDIPEVSPVGSGAAKSYTESYASLF